MIKKSDFRSYGESKRVKGQLVLSFKIKPYLCMFFFMSTRVSTY